MQRSARNQIPGTVRSITLGETTAEVVLEVADGIVIKSEITKGRGPGPRTERGQPGDRRHQSTDVITAVA